ncbi:hypothetical protein ESCO_005060 [Escovopsis weberi]|uniref:Uncharacterized protein n=1 Tax=Escovopsis weberi TaxID=150374 RepID=A0A0M8MY19_ESCWE|nr:hypothetical protein ESCO_005060 [Escovopsis weberi]
MVRVRGSRRAAALQPGDYDHEIILVDDDEDGEGEADNGIQQPRDTSIEGPGMTAIATFSPLDSNTINRAAGGSGNSIQGEAARGKFKGKDEAGMRSHRPQ